MWKDLLGWMLWMSAFSGVVLALLILASVEGSIKWPFALPIALYGVGATVIARRWRKLVQPSPLQWLTGWFFGALPILYGLLISFER